MLSNLVWLIRITEGGLEVKPPSAWRFFEKAILMPLDYISHVFRAIWKNLNFNISKPIEMIKLFNSPFIRSLSKTSSKSFILVLNFNCKWYGLGKMHCLLQYFGRKS